MKKLVFLFLIVGASLAALLTYFDFFTAFIPGWHTTIFPLWLVVLVIVLAWMFTLLFVKMVKVIFCKK